MGITRRSIINSAEKSKGSAQGPLIGRGVRRELESSTSLGDAWDIGKRRDFLEHASIDQIENQSDRYFASGDEKAQRDDVPAPEVETPFAPREWWHEVSESEVEARYSSKKSESHNGAFRTSHGGTQVQRAADSNRMKSREEVRAANASKELDHFGPLTSFMVDESIEEIWLNNPHRIFIARSGVSQLTNLVMTSDEVRNLIERLLMWGGRRLDLSHPFVDARLPDGSRLHVAIPDVTSEHWAVNIRKHLMRGKSLDELREQGVCSEEVSQFLDSAICANLNVLVSGSTGSGKTTLLNALASAISGRSRLITVEEVFELRPQVPDWVALQTRPPNLQGEGEIPIRKLIKESLRMRPTHLVVGEIREAESLDLLIALNSGLPGMATIHANSARDAIDKLQTLPLLAGENITHAFIGPMVAQSIDLVVHVAMDMKGTRRIREVSFVSGRIEGGRVEVEPLFTLREESENYERGLGELGRVFKK